MDRRGFFQSLITAGATVTNELSGKPLKHRKRDKAANTRFYHGPFLVPADVAEALREDPALYKLRGGKDRLALRYVDGEGVTWLVRSRIPEHRGVVGEIIRTPRGRQRQARRGRA